MVMEVWGLTRGDAGGMEGKLRGTVGRVAKPAGPGQARPGHEREQTKTSTSCTSNSAHAANRAVGRDPIINYNRLVVHDFRPQT